MDQYYVVWRSASDPRRVFYESFPPHFNRDPINADPERYSVDPRDFSLTISGVTPADSAFPYVCVLGVEDPLQPSTELLYSLTEDVNLTLSIFSESFKLHRE